jgi:hypothetical protein
VGDNRGCFVFDVLTIEFGRNSLENVFYIDFFLRISTSSRLVPNERLSMMMGRGGREVEYLPCDPRVAGSISTLAICVTSLSKMFALTCSDTLS